MHSSSTVLAGHSRARALDAARLRLSTSVQAPARPSVRQSADWRRQRNESIHHALMGKSNALVVVGRGSLIRPRLARIHYHRLAVDRQTDTERKRRTDRGSGQIDTLTTLRRCTYTLARVKRLGMCRVLTRAQTIAPALFWGSSTRK